MRETKWEYVHYGLETHVPYVFRHAKMFLIQCRFVCWFVPPCVWYLKLLQLSSVDPEILRNKAQILVQCSRS
jgi:hypothetical protein